MKAAEKLKNAEGKELLVIFQDTSVYDVDIKCKSGIWNDKEYQSNIIDIVTALGEIDMWIKGYTMFIHIHMLIKSYHLWPNKVKSYLILMCYYSIRHQRF